MLDDEERLERLQEEPRDDIPMSHRVRRFVEALQIRIVKRFQQLDSGVELRVDEWEHHQEGGGITSVLQNGELIEKAGINTSAVSGELPDRLARVLEVEPKPYFATGLSLVIHPLSPFVPTVHANFRYLCLGSDRFEPDDQWFGGGADMTPYYPFFEDVQHFHRVWKDVCDRHDVADYAAFKKECDEYFYLSHREEARGVGGIFFDYQREHPEATFFFVRDAGRKFLSSYAPIVQRRRDLDYGRRERRYQCIRRGRYVEFNLLHDRGTRFGIETGGRTESILMSLPPHVQWPYNWNPEPGSVEEQLLWYFEPRDWLELDPEAAPEVSFDEN